MTPHRIYVAGPYSSDQPDEVSLNVQRAEQAGRDLLVRGHFPFVPHCMTTGWEVDHRLGYEDFMRLAMEWLSACDWLLFLGHSPGADRELAAAEARGMAVFRSVDEVPEVSR